jgi:hypothetical protein
MVANPSQSLLEWQPSQKTHDGLSFLDLPQELRDMVYDECLIATRIGRSNSSDPEMLRFEWIDPSFKGVRNKKKWLNIIPGIPNPVIRKPSWKGRSRYRPQSPALLATCHQIHAEAAPVMYGNNFFALCARKHPDRGAVLNRAGIYPLYALLVRRIRVDVFYDWDYATIKGFQKMMALVQKDVLPFCTNLTWFHWTVISRQDGFYSEVFWEKWEPLWRQNRKENFAARISLFTDRLKELMPSGEAFSPFLYLDINPCYKAEYPYTKFYTENQHVVDNNARMALFKAVRADMDALRLGFLEAFKRMKEKSATGTYSFKVLCF